MVRNKRSAFEKRHCLVVKWSDRLLVLSVNLIPMGSRGQRYCQVFAGAKLQRFVHVRLAEWRHVSRKFTSWVCFCADLSHPWWIMTPLEGFFLREITLGVKVILSLFCGTCYNELVEIKIIHTGRQNLSNTVLKKDSFLQCLSILLVIRLIFIILHLFFTPEK